MYSSPTITRSKPPRGFALSLVGLSEPRRLNTRGVRPVELEYKDIPEFPGYRISNFGEVQSCWKKKGLGWGSGSTWIMSKEWHTLRPSSPDGYLKVNLTRNGNHYRIRVHTLVMLTFVGPRPKGMEVRHFPDPDKKNCRLDNLLYGTRSENMRDRVSQGGGNRGEKHPLSRLTANQVIQIRSLLTTRTNASLAREFGVNPSTISSISRRVIWSWLEDS
jgi:hypothetical protein